MPFKSLGGDVRDIFVSETELIERFTGKQLWLWGARECGRLGDGNFTGYSATPNQTNCRGSNWTSVSLGCQHSTAVKSDGRLWVWGSGFYGQLGNLLVGINSTATPTETDSATTNWSSVSAGCRHTAATKTDGTLWLWGGGAYGRLGNGDSFGANRSSPVQTISGGTNWKSVSLGDVHSTAIKTDGTLWLWGRNYNGQLGINTSSGTRSSPVQTISGGNNWKVVSARGFNTAAIKTDGTLWIWGANTLGQIGDNSTTARSSPVQSISSGNNWKSVSAGCVHTAAIKTDGSLWLWGAGGSGGLGNNSTIGVSSPVQTISGGTNWRSVSIGVRNNSAAIKTDGSLWLWGYGALGTLGTGSTGIQVSSPVQTISGGTNWRSVSLERNHSSATRLEEF